MELFLKVLRSDPPAPKGKKQKKKNERRESVGLLNPLEVASARGGGACNNRKGATVAACLLVRTSVTESNNQQS